VKKKSIFSLIILVFLLTACQPAKTPSPTTLSPSSTAIPATQTPSPTVAKATPIRLPTFTKPPPKPTLSQQEIAGKVLTELSIDETHAYSPDGYCEWKRILAWPGADASYDTEGNFFTYVTVNCGNQDPWVLVKLWSPAIMGYSIPDLLGWSVEGKYLYFADKNIPDGCQPLGGWQHNLWRVDLKSGKINPIPLDWTGGITLSPDTSKVIYYTDMQAPQVGIYDLANGTEQHFSVELPQGVEYGSIGNFTWAPDAQSALFIVEYGDTCFPSGYSLRRVDFATSQVSTLVEMENETRSFLDQTLSILEWVQNYRVKISIDHQDYWLDPASGVITPILNPPS
jgi:hypothetical protein